MFPFLRPLRAEAAVTSRTQRCATDTQTTVIFHNRPLRRRLEYIRTAVTNFRLEVSLAITEHILQQQRYTPISPGNVGTGTALSVRRLGHGLENPWFELQQEQELYLSSKTPRAAVRPTQPPTQWLTAPFFKGSKAAEAWDWPFTSI